MTVASLLAAALSILLGALGQLFLKLGATRLAMTSPGAGAGDVLRDAVTNWQLLLGIAFYGSSAVVWIYVLSVLSLSVAYPMVGLSFVIVMLLSALVLGEAIVASQVAGCALILLGIYLVTRG